MTREAPRWISPPLVDVLGFTTAAVPEAMVTPTTSVYSLLQRAQATIDKRPPESSQQAPLRSFGDESLREVVDRYVNAWTNNDLITPRGRKIDELNAFHDPDPALSGLAATA